jgi:hypothetical protein
MKFTEYNIKTDLVVVGGGLPGIVASIAASRMGLSVSLINNRGFIGGNTSAEIGVCANGADGSSEFNFNARETGIMGEIILENLHRNPQGNRYHWDTVLMDFIYREKNINLFMNTNIDTANVDEKGNIVSVLGVQNTSEKNFKFSGDFFVDNTGDGTLGYLAGAEFRKGREAKKEFDESIAPEVADEYTLLSTILFNASDKKKPLPFVAPSYALDIEKSGILENRVIPKKDFKDVKWYYEIGGGLDQISDTEIILEQHRALVQGIWDYIKNSGQYESQNYDLDFISCIAGKRESRRLMGDYILTQNDIVGRTDFKDVVAYGGWSVDLHSLMGMYGKDDINCHYVLEGIYQIPYRCFYSKNINNLFVVGRCMSTTHVAFGSTRVSATLALGGHVVGIAAYLCKKNNTNPRGIYNNHIEELQKLLMQQDCYVIGKKFEDKNDVASNSKVKVSSVSSLSVTKIDALSSLEKTVGFSLPVTSNPKQATIFVDAEEDTELTYNIYKSDKVENYHPAVLLKKGIVKISKGYSEANLELDIDEKGIFLFIEIEKNPIVKLAYSNSRIPGVTVVNKSDISHITNHADILTLERKYHIWNKNINQTICFTTRIPQDVYRGENLTNGYIRPYGNPNIWLAENAIGEWFELHFDKEENISKVKLTFDSFLDFRIFNTRPYEFNAFSTIIKDYDLYVKQGNEFKLVEQVKGNYHRVNEITFDKVRCNGIKIIIKDTNGSKKAGIYAVNVY